MFGLSLNDGASWAQIIGTVFGLIAAVYGTGVWLRRVLISVIDERIAPIHERIDSHMDEEDMALTRVADAIELIAANTHTHIPSRMLDVRPSRQRAPE